MDKIRKIMNIDELNDIFNEDKVIILKHSPACPISAGARMRFEEFVKNCEKDAKFYIVDVLSGRGISKEIENRTGIKHESPQVICLKNGKCVLNKSHFEINSSALNEALEEM